MDFAASPPFGSIQFLLAILSLRNNRVTVLYSPVSYSFKLCVGSRMTDDCQNICMRVGQIVKVCPCFPKGPFTAIYGFETKEAIFFCGVVLEPTEVDYRHREQNYSSDQCPSFSTILFRGSQTSFALVLANSNAASSCNATRFVALTFEPCVNCPTISSESVKIVGPFRSVRFISIFFSAARRVIYSASLFVRAFTKRRRMMVLPSLRLP